MLNYSFNVGEISYSKLSDGIVRILYRLAPNSSLKLYDVYPVGKSQTQESMFPVTVPFNKMGIFTFTPNTDGKVWYLCKLWDPH